MSGHQVVTDTLIVSDARVEIRHAGRKVGIWVEEAVDIDDDDQLITREAAAFVEPESALRIGQALVDWATPRLEAKR